MVKINSNREFLTKLLVIGAPILLQSFLSASLNFIDVFMVGQLGKIEVAAVGIGNQIFFLFLMLNFSITSGAAIFTAQYWERKI